MPIVNEATLHTAGSAASRRPAAGLTTCSGIRYYLLSWGLPSWVVKRDGARTLLISLSAPQLPGSTRKNSERD